MVKRFVRLTILIKKKNFKQPETGKGMFSRLYELSESAGDGEMRDFCRDILEVFERAQCKRSR